MPGTGWTPSIVPRGVDQNVYLVVDDFGRDGRVYREADVITPVREAGRSSRIFGLPGGACVPNPLPREPTVMTVIRNIHFYLWVVGVSGCLLRI
jgi:hypothetical protein